MAKNVMNGIVIGVIAAIAVVYISTTLSWLGFVNTMMTSMTQWFLNQTWWPTTIAFLQNIVTVKYILAGVIGMIIGLWVEYR